MKSKRKVRSTARAIRLSLQSLEQPENHVSTELLLLTKVLFLFPTLLFDHLLRLPHLHRLNCDGPMQGKPFGHLTSLSDVQPMNSSEPTSRKVEGSVTDTKFVQDRKTP